MTILSHIARIVELAAENEKPRVCDLCTPEQTCYWCGSGLVYTPNPITNDED